VEERDAVDADMHVPSVPSSHSCSTATAAAAAAATAAAFAPMLPQLQEPDKMVVVRATSEQLRLRMSVMVSRDTMLLLTGSVNEGRTNERKSKSQANRG